MNLFLWFRVTPLFVVLLFSCNNVSKRKLAKEKADTLILAIGEADALDHFPEKYFPKEQITPILTNLADRCDFKNREGLFINDFYQKNVVGSDQVTFIYEYHLACGGLRLLLRYELEPEVQLNSMFIESIDVDNYMILEPERRLKKH